MLITRSYKPQIGYKLEQVSYEHFPCKSEKPVWLLQVYPNCISPKFIAVWGKKQVVQMTSAECSEMVTVLYSMNVNGSAVDPVLSRPRLRYKDFFLRGVLTGGLGLMTQ